jgi:ribosomal protein S1
MKDLSDFVKDAQRKYPLGLRVRGVVVQHATFGIFVDIGDPMALGLVQVIDFLDDVRDLASFKFPAVGASIEAVVIGWKDTAPKGYRYEVALSVKPSQLRVSVHE